VEPCKHERRERNEKTGRWHCPDCWDSWYEISTWDFNLLTWFKKLFQGNN
jgi:hypothetical protein